MDRIQDQSMADDKRKRKALAMAYVPWQRFNETYEPQRALMAGTIFPELDKPFTGRKGGGRRCEK